MTKYISFMLAGVLLSGLVVLPFIAQGSRVEKVTICHATGNNTFQTIHTSVNGISGHFENSGTPKAGHETDLLYEGEVSCPTSGGGGGGGGSTPSCTDGIQNQDETGIDTGGVCGSTGGGGGGGCSLPSLISGFDVQNATPNDGQLELVWTSTSTNATSINIRWGLVDGTWTNTSTSANDGFEAIPGLRNGIPVWFQLQPVNSCGANDWTISIDPLP